MIIFTEHAEQKLDERNLKRVQVIEILRKPEKITKTYGDRFAAFKKIGKLYLKVIYKKENKDLIIITQHWVKEMK